MKKYSLATEDDLLAIMRSDKAVESFWKELAMKEETFVSFGVSRLADGIPAFRLLEYGDDACTGVQAVVRQKKIILIIMEKTQGPARAL